MSSSIPSWQISTAHAQPFRGARDLAFCLKVPLDSLLVWASSEGSGETARMRRLALTFAARIGDKYQIRLTRSNCLKHINIKFLKINVKLTNFRLELKSITTEIYSLVHYWFLTIPRQFCFWLYKYRIGEIIFTRSCHSPHNSWVKQWKITKLWYNLQNTSHRANFSYITIT